MYLIIIYFYPGILVNDNHDNNVCAELLVVIVTALVKMNPSHISSANSTLSTKHDELSWSSTRYPGQSFMFILVDNIILIIDNWLTSFLTQELVSGELQFDTEACSHLWFAGLYENRFKNDHNKVFSPKSSSNSLFKLLENNEHSLWNAGSRCDFPFRWSIQHFGRVWAGL